MSVSTVSMTHTPQAKDDVGSTLENVAFLIPVMNNDEGGAARRLYSLDQTNRNLGTGSDEVFLEGGSSIRISGDSIYFDPKGKFDYLAAGQIASESFSYAIQLGNGAISIATVTLTITGTNDGPVAVADTAAGHENETLTIDVLSNDTDVDDGHVFTLLSAEAPAGKGSASVVGNKLVFDPGTAFDGLAKDVTETVTLSYVMKDEHGAESTSTVTLTITGTNDGATIAGAFTGTVVEDGNLTAAGTLLVSDADQGEAELQPITNGVGTGGFGTFQVQANGQWTYSLTNSHPAVQALPANATISDSIIVTSEDGTATQVITVTIVGAADGPNVINGTPGSDWLYGTSGIDHIFGNGGFDYIYGLGGDDLIELHAGFASGGGGDDTISVVGDPDDDYYYYYTSLFGGDGNDILKGRVSDNSSDYNYINLSGGPGDDTLIGSTSNTGFAGYNILIAGTGNDTVVLGANAYNYVYFDDISTGDSVSGEGLYDYLSLKLTAGDDTFVLGANWILNGDQLNIESVFEQVSINGGAGDDIIDVSGATGLNSVQLLGGTGNDVLVGLSNGNNYMELQGASSGDSVTGGTGWDYLYVRPESWSSADSHVISSAGPGSYLVSGATVTGVEYLQIDLGNYGNAVTAADSLAGTGLSQIFIYGGYSAGQISVDFSLSTGTSVVFYAWGSGDVNFVGSAVNDVVYDTYGDDTIDARAGNDNIFLWNGGADTIVVQPGSDHDYVVGFNAGTGSDADKIDVRAFGFDDISDVLAIATSNGHSTTLDFGNGDTLTLYGVTLASLDSSDFIFAM